MAALASLVAALALADISFLAGLSGITIICSFWLMHKACGVFNLRALTIPGFFYYGYLTEVLAPAFFVYAAKRDPYRFPFLFAVESAMITVPIGILLVSRISGFSPRETVAYFKSPGQESPLDPGPEIYTLFMVTAWVITCMYVLEVRTIPLFYMFSHPGEALLLGRLREESLKLLDSQLRYLYPVLSSAIYPLLIALGFARFLQTRSALWTALFLGTLIPGLLYAGFTIQKGPVAIILLMLFLQYYIFKGGKIRAKLVLSGLAVVMGFPVLVEMLMYAGEKNTTIGASLWALGDRMFYIPAEVLYYRFEMFPYAYPYQHGKSIGKLANLTGDQAFEADNVVGRYMRPYAPYSIMANAPFVGNLHVDFGLAGVLVGGVVAGMILQVAQVYVIRRGKTCLSLALYANFLHNFLALSAAALPVVLMSNGPFFIVLMAWMMMVLESIILRALRSRHSYSPPGARWVSRAEARIGARLPDRFRG
jgi:hypothetical protein